MRPGQVPSVSSRNKTLAIAVKNYAKADMTLFFFFTTLFYFLQGLVMLLNLMKEELEVHLRFSLILQKRKSNAPYR